MNSTHAHLLLNHFPIIGTLIGTMLLLFGILKKNTSIQKISLITIFFMAIIAVPVFLTGEPAEESIEKLPGIIKSIIEEHEEAAEVAFWFMMLTGVLSIASVAMQMIQFKMAKLFIMLSLLLSIITTGLMARAGYLGGQIRHTEIRGTSTSNQTIEQTGGEDDN